MICNIWTHFDAQRSRRGNDKGGMVAQATTSKGRKIRERADESRNFLPGDRQRPFVYMGVPYALDLADLLDALELGAYDHSEIAFRCEFKRPHGRPPRRSCSLAWPNLT